MKWEITSNAPELGDTRFRLRFAFLPTIVLNKLTMTDHWIWLETYLQEEEYMYSDDFLCNYKKRWNLISKTIYK